MIDNRSVTQEHVDQWHRILKQAGYDEGHKALDAHYAASDDWLTPARLMGLIRKQREQTVVGAERAERLEQTFDPKRHPGQPENIDELVGFYKDLWERHPWGANENPNTVAERHGIQPPAPKWRQPVS